MSDENNNEDTGQEQDHLKNLKSEFNRKFENTSSQLDQLAASNQQVMQLLQELKQSPSSSKGEEGDSMSQYLYEDPDKYAELLEKKVEDRVSKKFQAQQKSQERSAQVLAELSQHYPELRDQSSDLTRKAVQIFDSFSAEDKVNVAVAYKAAINEAASDLGIQRASKRKQQASDFDDFTLGASSGSNRRNDSKPKLATETILFAEAMGMDTDDKALLKRLAERSKKNFKKGGPVSA